MKIIRNMRDSRQVKFLVDTIAETKIEIELTDAEIEAAYRERQAYYHTEDIKSRLAEHIDEDDPDDLEIWVTGSVFTTAGEIRRMMEDAEWLEKARQRFDKALWNNGGYCECYNMTADYIIEQMFEEE